MFSPFFKSSGLGAARKSVLVLATVTAIGLTGCLPNIGPAQPQAGSANDSAQPTAQKPESNPADEIPSLGGILGANGDACVAVESALATLTLVPFSTIAGGDIGEAKATLDELLTKVPDELKPHLSKLESITSSAVADPGNFDTENWTTEIQAIGTWITEKCTGK